MKVLRLFRGILSTAILWSVAWAVLGAGVALVSVMMSAMDVPMNAYPGIAISSAIFSGIVGLWAGAFFAVTMAISERRRAFAELSMARVVTWGVLGGVSYVLLTWTLSRLAGETIGGLGVALGMTSTFGAISAWAMLHTARRARTHAPSQLGAGHVESWTSHASGNQKAHAPTRPTIL